MARDDDPPSTRCTFVLSSSEPAPFALGAPGDRLEILEELGGRSTGRMLTARILKVQHLGPRLLLREGGLTLPDGGALRYEPGSGRRCAGQGDTMEELIKLVSQKTGLSAEHARTAVETVVGFLKAKLPPAIAGQVDGVLNGGGVSGVLDALGGGGLGALGDMFVKK